MGPTVQRTLGQMEQLNGSSGNYMLLFPPHLRIPLLGVVKGSDAMLPQYETELASPECARSISMPSLRTRVTPCRSSSIENFKI